MLSENETLLIRLPENSNIGQLRGSLKKFIDENYSKSNLGNLNREISKVANIFLCD